MSSEECITAGHFQNQNANPCRLSPDGHFGSKFVTVVAKGMGLLTFSDLVLKLDLPAVILWRILQLLCYVVAVLMHILITATLLFYMHTSLLINLRC